MKANKPTESLVGSRKTIWSFVIRYQQPKTALLYLPRRNSVMFGTLPEAKAIWDAFCRMQEPITCGKSWISPVLCPSPLRRYIKADYWLLKYNDVHTDMTYESLKNEYNLYANFDAFKQKHIFAINTGKTPFYESGSMEPDLVLADMVHIFHPELLPGYKPRYYFNLEKDK
jgi:hypothetical protein